MTTAALNSCALTDCGAPACPVCIWSRPNPPTPDDQRWRWLRDHGMSDADIALVRQATLKQRAKMAGAAKKKAEKKRG